MEDGSPAAGVIVMATAHDGGAAEYQPLQRRAPVGQERACARDTRSCRRMNQRLGASPVSLDRTVACEGPKRGAKLRPSQEGDSNPHAFRYQI
jgi:hypothetical protein